MKKLISVLVFVFALLLAGAAYAGGPVNPYQGEVWQAERMLREPQADSAGKGTGEALTISCTKTPALDGTGAWSVRTNSTYGQVTKMSFYILMKDYSTDYTTVYMKSYTGAKTSFTSCRLVSGGSYQFMAYVEYNNQGAGYIKTYEFTLQDDAAHTSLAEKIQQVVTEQKAPTQWQTAVNLHDWLVTHVYYDPNYEYYGADMILRGYGVCDGYAKAYLLMCKKAGIPVYRVTNDNHAWNAIKLDGQWYYIDCTWDDPIGATTAVSGYEGHTYVCLNASLLALDHPKPWQWEGSSVLNCTALDDNYTVRSGEWKDWGKYAWVYDTNPKGGWTVHTLQDLVGEAYGQGSRKCAVELDDWDGESGWLWYMSGSELKSVRIGNREKQLLIFAVPKSRFTTGELAFSASLTASGKTLSLPFKVSGWAGLTETGTLTIPKNLKTIPAYAFWKCRATTVVIQSGCTAIGSYAFANSRVCTVHIPTSVTGIDPNAFANCNGNNGRLLIITKNSTAAAYAQEKGWLVAEP